MTEAMEVWFANIPDEAHRHLVRMKTAALHLRRAETQDEREFTAGELCALVEQLCRCATIPVE